MTTHNTNIREEFNQAFPPPMLLGQNQERVADWWLSRFSTLLEGLEGEIKDKHRLSINSQAEGSKRWNEGFNNALSDCHSLIRDLKDKLK